ncbi:hypothetical protein, partial [Pseudoalteromonas sp. MMG012]|uniref:hypothetical protein n=1 Tax=Pseudoalteromonas sp. MMG012 TaxID=2822686 RepID=UPI001B3A3369
TIKNGRITYVPEFQEFEEMISLSLNFPNEIETDPIYEIYIHIDGVFSSKVNFISKWFYPEHSTADISIKEVDIDKVEIDVSYRERSKKGVAFCGPNRKFTLRELLNITAPARLPGPPAPPDFN